MYTIDGFAAVQKSQNCRKDERLEGICPVHPPQLLRTMSGHVWNVSKDGDSPTSLGNLCQCSVTLTLKKCFLMFRWDFLYFNLYPLPLLLSLGITKTSLPQSSLHSHIRYLFALITSALSLLFAMLSSSGSVCLSMTSILRPESSLWPFAGLFPVCSCLSFTRKFRTGPSTPDVSLVLTGKEGSPPLTCWKHTTYCN